MLGAGEDQHLTPVAVADQVGQQRLLARLVAMIDALFDALGGGVARRHVDRRRGMQQTAGEAADLRRERRREQQVLTLRRQQGEDAPDVADEAHVEHAVGLVQHQNLDMRQIDGARGGVIQQTARRGDDDIDATTQRCFLGTRTDAAKDQGVAQTRMAAVGRGIVGDLRGQLARRRQHQRARLAPRSALHQPAHQRQHEGSGLAGAGLCGGEQITAFQHHRDGLGLDRRGNGKAKIGDRTRKGGVYAEFRKIHLVCILFGLASAGSTGSGA